MIKKSELYQQIRAARKRAGLRQIDVAIRLEVDRTAVTQWESKDAGRRTRPDIDRLEEFGHMTRTPLWWLLSDDVDVSSSWPEIANEQQDAAAPAAATLRTHIRDFWSSACLQVRERREDLWDGDVWEPQGPQWMAPITPNVMTSRAVATFIAAPRPDLARVAAAASALLAFEVAIERQFERKVLLIWKPRAEGWPSKFNAYLTDVDRISPLAHSLTDSLKITYLEVQSVSAAVEYLTQIL